MSETFTTTIPGTPAFKSNTDLKTVEIEQRLASLENEFDHLKLFVLEQLKTLSERKS